jgi:hypothetical protein
MISDRDHSYGSMVLLALENQQSHRLSASFASNMTSSAQRFSFRDHNNAIVQRG